MLQRLMKPKYREEPSHGFELEGKFNPFPTLPDELLGACRSFRLWLYLAWSDVRQRYRGSVLGPLWITISTAVFVCALSVINAELFKTPAEKYIPTLSAGFVIWYFISGSLTESTSALIAGKGLITQISLPFFVHILRVVMRNLIILFHNFLVVLVVLVWFKINPFPELLWLILALPLISILLVFCGMLLAMLGARYRDLQQVVASFLQVLFFVSPITWEAKQISTATWILEANPVYYLIEVLRSPMLGSSPKGAAWLAASLLVVFSSFLSILLFWKKRDKIPFWVQ